MLTSDKISLTIENYFKSHSGLDTHRKYVGMSHIGDCPLKIYSGVINGIKPEQVDFRSCYRGYFYERELRQIMEKTGIIKPNSQKEITAQFDQRFCGHIDGEHKDGSMVEIKSMKHKHFENVVKNRKVCYRYYAQIQTYMKYGNFESTYLICISTETMEVYTLRLVPNERIQEELEKKAKMILKCIDGKIKPECECNKCSTIIN